MPFDPTTAAPVEEFDPSTAQEVSPETATPIDEPQKEQGVINTAKTTLDLAGKLPAMGREVLQATAVDVVDMVLGIPSLIAKTLETGFLAGAGAIRGDENNLKNVAGFMAEESAKPGYAASQAPLRTITDLAGKPLPQSPIGVGLEKAMGAVEQRGEEAAEATGVEGIKYATPMLMEGGMSMLAAHATAKGQARQKANTARAEKIQEAKAAGLTTNEMAEAILKKAADRGINTEGITKPVIKATLDDIAEYYGTKVVKGQPPVSELTGLNKTMQHLDTRKTPRVQKTLIVEPKQVAQLDPAKLVNALDKNRRVEPKQAGAVDFLKESIAKNGVVRPITVTVSTKDGMAYVTDGNTRTLAAFEAGEKTVPVRIEKTDVPFTKEQKAKAKPINDLGITEDMIPDRKLTPQQLADKKELQALLRKETTTPDNVSNAADVLAEQNYNKTVLQELPAGMRKAAELMLERQKKGLRGGLVIGPMPKLRQQLHKDARKFVPVDFLEELQKEIPASADNSWGAFYHPVTGNIYFNTLTIKNPKDVAARFLHEVSHAANNPKLNAEIMKRLADPSTFEGNLANLPPELAYYEARGLYSRVRTRMQYAGERDMPTEATAYFITETMRMGRQAGFSRLDTGFWQWATKALPPEALDWLKQIVAKIRATMYRYGVELKESDLTPDDIVALTEANAKRIGEGKQETVFGTEAGADKGMQASAIKEGNEVGLVPRLTGTHYSPTQRPVLKGGMYGTGAKGAERARLAKAEDPRIKTRVSFYVDEGKGVFPEQGVGNYRHDVPLDNLYDAAKNPQKLPADDLNKFESAVLDAGFDGYYVKEAFDRQGAAVVLGDAAKEIWVPESTSISLADFKPENVSNILKKDNWTILTAENPMGKQLTPKENTLRMNALHAELTAMGIHYKEAEGFYGGNKEHSVVIFDIGKEQALEIGKRFDQDSVLIKDGLLYHDGTIAPATGIKTKDLTPDDGLTHIPATGATFAIGIDFNKRVPAGLRRADEATFQEQRLHAPKPTEAEIDAAIKSGQAEIAAIDKVMARSALVLADVKRFIGPKKQRGAIGYLYASTLEEAIKIADARNGMVGTQVNRGWKVEVPMSIEEAAKLAPEDVINWALSPEDLAKRDFFKKQKGAVDTKLLITSGIVLGGATLGAILVPDEDTTQGLLMGAALGFAGINLPKATKAISANWKKSLKTAAVGTTYATIGALVDKDNPVEGILVGSALFGTRFLPKTKAHPEDALIHARNGNIAAEKRLTAMTAQAMRDAVPDKLQREQISVLMENPAFQGRTPQERLVVNAWRGLAQSYHDIAMNENIKMGFIEGYVSHIVERGALPQSEVQRVMGELFGKGGAGVGGRAKFTKERMYPTFESLEKALEGTSLKLKTKDIADITQIYADTMNRTIENQRLINNLKEATLGDVNGLNARLLTEDMQPSYVKMLHPQLQAYYIHPDVAPSLKFIFDARDHAELTNGLVALNRATKRINVLGSFFHAKSLLEAYALAGGNLFTAKGAIEASLKQFREGGLGDELDLGMRAGLRVELPTEVSQQALVQIGQLADMYVGRLFGKKIEVGEKALGGLERLQEKTFDKFTWDYLHTGLKTATYLRLMEDYKLSKKGQGVDINTFRQGVASHINDTFGGLDWYRVMSEAKTEAGRKILQGTISPSGRDLLGVAIFAPDWTLSTVRAMTKALPGGSANPANAQLARQYAARTAVLYASVLVPMNYALSGHFPWDNNDPTRLDLGDGTNLQVVKHSMEFAEWVRDPWKTFGNKMGFFPRTFEALRYGVQYPTGPEIEGSRLGYVVQQIAPFSARSFQGHLEPEVSAARSLLGAMGISVYGMTEEEKEAAKEQRAFNRMMETPEMKQPKMR